MSYAQALDALIDTLRHVNAPGDAAGIEEMTGCAESASMTRQMIRSGLELGAPYYWAPNTCAVIDGVWRDMPDWTLRRECLPSEDGFFHFAAPLAVPCPGDHDCETDRITGLLWHTRGELPHGSFPPVFIWPIIAGPRRRAGQFLSSHLWMAGRGMEDGLTEEAEMVETWRATSGVSSAFRAAVYKIFAAALAFMEQRILVSTTEHAPRSTRKRAIVALREDRPVRVVHLRRAQEIGHGHQDSAGVEWSCQWVVRGHWRQQACGKDRAERRPTFILPHVKGNPDKPLRLPSERVFAVVR